MHQVTTDAPTPGSSPEVVKVKILSGYWERDIKKAVRIIHTPFLQGGRWHQFERQDIVGS
jgi:hypothetical protein